MLVGLPGNAENAVETEDREDLNKPTEQHLWQIGGGAQRSCSTRARKAHARF
jgi:hypothetical protein